MKKEIIRFILITFFSAFCLLVFLLIYEFMESIMSSDTVSQKVSVLREVREVLKKF